jgi:lipid II:glycine glycyltransferase (peptidoglycan interpeptide bridge formation enzyme)
VIRVADVDKIDRPGWEDLLSRFDDATIYQTWAYGAAHWGEGRLSHLVLKTAEGAVGIAQVTVMRIPILGAGIAYVPWGPLWRRKGEAADTGNFREMVARLRAEYAAKRGLLLRIAPNVAQEGSDRFEAILGSEGYARTSIPGYRTLVLDLTRPADAIRKSLDQKWRNQLNRSEKNGLSVVEGAGVELFERFAGVYREMIGRKRFRTSVDIDLFAEVQRNLPEEQKMRIFLCECRGVAVAVAVGTCIGDTGIYLFGATNDEGKERKGSYLLQWRMIAWMKEAGCRRYDLGGIDPEGNPGVYHFKNGISNAEVRHIPPREASGKPLSDWVVRGGETCRNLLQRVRTAEFRRSR